MLCKHLSWSRCKKYDGKSLESKGDDIPSVISERLQNRVYFIFSLDWKWDVLIINGEHISWWFYKLYTCIYMFCKKTSVSDFDKGLQGTLLDPCVPLWLSPPTILHLILSLSFFEFLNIILLILLRWPHLLLLSSSLCFKGLQSHVYLSKSDMTLWDFLPKLSTGVQLHFYNHWFVVFCLHCACFYSILAPAIMHLTISGAGIIEQHKSYGART